MRHKRKSRKSSSELPNSSISASADPLQELRDKHPELKQDRKGRTLLPSKPTRKNAREQKEDNNGLREAVPEESTEPTQDQGISIFPSLL